MDPAYAAGASAAAHDGGQHVPWQMAAEHYDASQYPNLATLSVTTSPPSTQQQVQYHQFQYNPPQDQQSNGTNWHSYETAAYEVQRRPPGSSRSTTSSEKSLHNKRSMSAITTLSVNVEEDPGYEDPPGSAVELRAPNGAPFDDPDIVYGAEPSGSPVDGSGGSSGEHLEDLKPMDGVVSNSMYAYNVLSNSKTPTSNNFVTKLYQMINDPKSTHFISWTELGSSFVVSSVGEFSRTILGSHFKHNNFSSFVRQLNMYGFHKINRTPRAQRTSTDAQTWEFSHHKFLRGRPDLLDEIKRKALEPDPAVRQRVELPAEVAHQLGRMSDEYQSVVRELQAERAKVDRLTGVVKALFDVVSANFPGQLSYQFPGDLLDSHPPIYVTSPTDSHSGHQFSTYSRPMTAHTISPSSSPTSADFPPAQFTPSAASGPPATGQAPTNGVPLQNGAQPPQRRPMAHRMSFDHGPGQSFGGAYQSSRRAAQDGAHPSSPGGLSEAEFGHSPTTAPGVGPRIPKRQRTNDSAPSLEHPPEMPQSMRKLSRARSDSAPLGYGLGSGTSWDVGRPRSGSTRRPGPPPIPDYALNGMVNVGGGMMNNIGALNMTPPAAPSQPTPQQLGVIVSQPGAKDESMHAA